MGSRPRPKVNLKRLKRVTPDSKFYIDFEWWESSNLDLKTYLMTRLQIGDESDLDSDIEYVDLVDGQTGEVRRVDGFQYLLQAYFRQLPEDFVLNASLVDAAFCVLLSNANQPMTGREIAERIKKPARVVVRTLGGTTVYQGIRPIHEN